MRGPQLDLKVSFEKNFLTCNSTTQKKKSTAENLCWAHYSKSQIFVQKFNFDKTPTITQDFHPNFL